MSLQRVIITGGCGFVGQNLAIALLDKGFSVLILDTSPYPEVLAKYDNIYFVKVDLTNAEEVDMRVSGFNPVLIVHLASWGMSGEAMLNPLCQKINVQGTATLLNACFKNNISKFLYTSSYNVIFGNKEIVNGNENTPYFDETKQVDQYSSSKTRAEKLVLEANNKTMSNGEPFLSCSLRPAAIYGEGELRHLPRIIKHMDNGMFLVKIGNATVDWVHIDNLVNAFLLLIDKMMQTTSATDVPGGQAYFISDGSPIHNFDFLKPLCLARHRNYPSAVIPTSFMLCVSYCLEQIYFLTKACGCSIPPLLTRAEILKVGVTHYFSIDKANRDFGYKPLLNSVEGGARLAAYYSTPERLTNADYFEIVHIGWYISIIFGMSLLGMVALGSSAQLTNNDFIKAVNWLALTIFRSQQNLVYLFIAAVGAHVGESLYAMKLSFQIGCKNTWVGWGLQTLLLGFPSLRLIQRREKVVNR